MTEEGARDLAQSSPQGDCLHWCRLEARAFRDHSDVQLALGCLAPPPAAWRDLRPSRPALVQPLLAIAQMVRYRRASEDENRDNVERAARGH